MHCGHFKVVRIDYIIFLSNYTVVSFIPLSESNNIYKYVPKNCHIFVIQNGACPCPRKYEDMIGCSYCSIQDVC